MHSLKLGKFFTGEVIHDDNMPSARNVASEEQIAQAVNKGRGELEERKWTLWYELVHALDKKSVLFLRPHKSDDTKAWDINRKRFKGFERPLLHKLITELTILKTNSNEKIVDYLKRGEHMSYNL